MDTGPLMKHLRTFRSSKTFRFLLILFSSLGALYLLLFTFPGNRLLSPLLETALSSALSTPVTLERFSLTHNRFDLLLRDRSGNVLSSQGGFSLLTLRLYAHYRVAAAAPEGINRLKTPFKTEGSLSGGIASLDIRGNAQLLGGNLLYRVQLHRFALASLYASADRIAYSGMMRLMEYPSDTDTLLSGTVDLKGFDIRFVEGSIRVTTRTSRFEPTEPVPEGGEPFSLRSLLADERGIVRPFDVNVTLEASVQHLGILEQFTPMRLYGPAALVSTLRGDEKQLIFSGRGSVAGGDTTFSAQIDALEPQKVDLQVTHADVAGLFALTGTEAPLAGDADIRGTLAPERGYFDVRLSHASTVPAVLKRDYNLTQPFIRFDASLTAELDGDGARYRGTARSDLVRLEFADSVPQEQMLRELLKTLR